MPGKTMQTANHNGAEALQDANRTHMAKELGVGKSHVSLVLTGKRTPSLTLAAQMARVLGMSLDDFHRALQQVN